MRDRNKEMNQQQLTKIIDDDLMAGRFDNWHGISLDNVNNYRIEPRHLGFKDAVTGSVRLYWLVFDEDVQDSVDGYQIVYDETSCQFGLATKKSIPEKEIGSVLSHYDTFVEALSAM
jgi:hypothetical protein